MLKRLRLYCLTVCLLLSALTVLCGVQIAADRTEQSAFGEGQAVVAATHTEQRLDIGTANLRLTIELPVAPAQLLRYCEYLPFPFGNLAAVYNSLAALRAAALAPRNSA